MTVTSDSNQFAFNRINKIILCFKDKYEIELNQIINYDLNLDRCDYSYIDITNAFIDKEIFNRFCTSNDNVSLVHIESLVVTNESKNEVVVIDIPCDMRIRILRTDGDLERATEMYVQLEGVVK